jgi:hypothetical protein
MAYIADLSDYPYGDDCQLARAKAIGWLDHGQPFPTSPPDAAMLDRLWKFCQTSVAQTRGWHQCTFCDGAVGVEVQRDGQTLLLGTAEIRVFSATGQVYAAPTMIYHYVAVHHYAPPGEFVSALFDGPPPSSARYFELLRIYGLEWNPTSTGGHGFWDPSNHRPEDDDIPLIELMARSRCR